MGLLLLILEALRWIVLADVILSWVQQDPNAVPRNLTRMITQPMYAPFHALLPPEKTGGFDLSPIFVLIGISLVHRMLM